MEEDERGGGGLKAPRQSHVSTPICIVHLPIFELIKTLQKIFHLKPFQMVRIFHLKWQLNETPLVDKIQKYLV